MDINAPSRQQHDFFNQGHQELPLALQIGSPDSVDAFQQQLHLRPGEPSGAAAGSLDGFQKLLPFCGQLT